MSDLAPRLTEFLFADSDNAVYAVLDAASVPGLLPELARERPEHLCLYRGELEPDLAYCAPYLVRLEEGKPFTNWLLAEGWGNHWGIFALSQADFRTMRKHFRTFLIVQTPDGQQVYFRYYDPRVLRVYLPTCNPEETRIIFGPVLSYFCEDETPESLLSFRVDRDVPKKEGTKLVQP
jgi:hypothetical protein